MGEAQAQAGGCCSSPGENGVTRSKVLSGGGGNEWLDSRCKQTGLPDGLDVQHKEIKGPSRSLPFFEWVNG